MAIEDSVAVLDAKTGMARPVRRGDAIGAEVPVTVHASRSTQSLGQNLPPVHEDTRTVIVLPQGAVVRLTAGLTPGETVVLTNRATGADVLCRVSSVKSQPGVQHYVDLEFSQRAPGFWGDASPAQSAAVLETPAAVPRPSVLPAAAPDPPPPSVPERPVAAKPAPIAARHPAANPLNPALLAEPVSAAGPVRPADTVRPVRAPFPTQVSTQDAARASSSPLAATTLLGAETARGTSFGWKRRAPLVAAASVLLVAGTALGGYWFYLQEGMFSDIPAPRQFVTVPRSLAPPPVPPQAHSAAEDPGPTALNPAPLPLPAAEAHVISESGSPVQPVNRIEPPPAPIARAPLPEARRNSVAIGKLQAPSPRTLPSTPVTGEAPPMVVGATVDLLVAATESPLLAGTGSDAPPPPPGSRSTIGGQLQPPRLISSPAATYPPNARRQRVQGEVVMDALVDETGKVVETTVISGPVVLQSAAREAVRSWRYAPARLNGDPIPVHTTVNVRFSLN